MYKKPRKILLIAYLIVILVAESLVDAGIFFVVLLDGCIVIGIDFLILAFLLFLGSLDHAGVTWKRKGRYWLNCSSLGISIILRNVCFLLKVDMLCLLFCLFGLMNHILRLVNYRLKIADLLHFRLNKELVFLLSHNIVSYYKLASINVNHSLTGGALP